MKRFSKNNLIRMALLAGGAALVAKVIGAKKEQWTGLSESEVRHKVESGLPDKVAGEKRAAVADKVVATMKTRGLLDEDADETATEVSGHVESDIAVEADSDDEPSN